MNRVDRVEIAEEGDAEGLDHEVAVEQMRVDLVDLGVCATHPDLRDGPVGLRVGRSEDRIVLTWLLLDLNRDLKQR